MHYLITRAIERFVRDTYGAEFWSECQGRTESQEFGEDTLVEADAADTMAALVKATGALNKPLPAFLEDMGTYMVSHKNSHRLRRLLRFSGETFEDFLYSLDDLPGRARLAVCDLVIPQIEVMEETPGIYCLKVGPGIPGFGSFFLGALRAMADDYGALVLLEPHDDEDADEGAACIKVSLLDRDFAEGSDFALNAMFGDGSASMRCPNE